MAHPYDSEDRDASATAEVALLDDARRVSPSLDFELINTPVSKSSTPLFVDHLRRSAKPASLWMTGLEFELFGYAAGDLQRLDAVEVQAVLLDLAASSDDALFEEGIVAEVSTGAGGMDRVTVEPGGQIEFSGAPHRSLKGIEVSLGAHLARLSEIASQRGFKFLATGFDPLRTIEEQRWFPKPRYSVMRPYLATRGRRAWDMMCRTCAIQVNVDYGSEQDLAKKFVVGNRLAPFVTAMFAASPFENGKLSGYKSTRAAVWLETDADRASVSPLALGDNFSLEAFVDYALAVPMLFARRDGRYLDETTGLRFSKFLDGVFLDGERISLQPIFQDWTDHLTTIFTEARLKQYIELRSADSNTAQMALALQALWKGLMYDAYALDEALRLAPKLSGEETCELQEAVAREGLSARAGGVDVLRVAKDAIALAAEGLGRVASEEVKYLDILRTQVIDEEICPADILLRNWHGAWHQSMERVIEYLHIA